MISYSASISRSSIRPSVITALYTTRRQSADSACERISVGVPPTVARRSSISALPRAPATTFASTRQISARLAGIWPNADPPPGSARMTLLLRGRATVPRIEDEVERRPAIVDLRLVDLLGIHRTDQIGARQHQPA